MPKTFSFFCALPCTVGLWSGLGLSPSTPSSQSKIYWEVFHPRESHEALETGTSWGSACAAHCSQSCSCSPEVLSSAWGELYPSFSIRSWHSSAEPEGDAVPPRHPSQPQLGAAPPGLACQVHWDPRGNHVWGWCRSWSRNKHWKATLRAAWKGHCKMHLNVIES